MWSFYSKECSNAFDVQDLTRHIQENSNIILQTMFTAMLQRTTTITAMTTPTMRMVILTKAMTTTKMMTVMMVVMMIMTKSMTDN